MWNLLNCKALPEIEEVLIKHYLRASVCREGMQRSISCRMHESATVVGCRFLFFSQNVE